MPELSNIQTYVKLNDTQFKPSITKFSNILKRLGVWNDTIKTDLESLKWKIENNGMGYFSNPKMEFLPTHLNIKVKPLIIAWSPAIDKTFKGNWISFELLIETATIKNLEGNKYKKGALETVKKLATEMAIDFTETGIFFTNESQDGEEFDGLRTGDKNLLWNFDYAIIPSSLLHLYRQKPTQFTISLNQQLEATRTDQWEE